MVELGIVGGRNSGKTTLVETLVRDLVRLGYRVATVKHTAHEHTFDQEGKDTRRHREAGAGMTLAISGTELAMFSDPVEAYRQILMDAMAEKFHICLVEGDRSATRPKLLLTRARRSDDKEIPGNIVAVYGPAIDGVELPTFALDDVDGLVSFIVRRFLATSPEASNA